MIDTQVAGIIISQPKSGGHSGAQLGTGIIDFCLLYIESPQQLFAIIILFYF
jgi:hypothetical protein